MLLSVGENVVFGLGGCTAQTKHYTGYALQIKNARAKVPAHLHIWQLVIQLRLAMGWWLSGLLAP